MDFFVGQKMFICRIINYLILTNNCTLLIVKYDISGSTCCTREKKSYFKAESVQFNKLFFIHEKT